MPVACCRTLVLHIAFAQPIPYFPYAQNHRMLRGTLRVGRASVLLLVILLLAVTTDAFLGPSSPRAAQHQPHRLQASRKGDGKQTSRQGAIARGLAALAAGLTFISTAPVMAMVPALNAGSAGQGAIKKTVLITGESPLLSLLLSFHLSSYISSFLPTRHTQSITYPLGPS